MMAIHLDLQAGSVLGALCPQRILHEPTCVQSQRSRGVDGLACCQVLGGPRQSRRVRRPLRPFWRPFWLRFTCVTSVPDRNIEAQRTRVGAEVALPASVV
jgi:hypothetical protein